MLTHKKASLARNNGEIIIIMMMVSMMVDSYHYLYKEFKLENANYEV